jgi:cysteine-rich repeat protein
VALVLASACGRVPAPEQACGNGELDDFEECDDGNLDDGDACAPTCRWARCGDGYTRRHVEQCDDGNDVNDDGCSNDCGTCYGKNQLVWTGNGHCYTRHDEPLVWSEARIACEEEGGHLATFESPSEYAAVQAIIHADDPVAIGLSDEVSEGTYRWVTNEPVGFTGWATGNPDNVGGAADPPTAGEDCVGIDLMKGGWNDYTCEPHPYLCEDDGWLIDPHDGTAFRVVHEKLAWDDARANCERLGGHLATLTRETDNALVTLQVFGRPGQWIGATRDEAGTFAWITGEPMEHLEWENRQPDNYNGEEGCMEVIGRTGWNDRRCTTAEASLCEVEPLAPEAETPDAGPGVEADAGADAGAAADADVAAPRP